jgi:hypothetical protein
MACPYQQSHPFAKRCWDTLAHSSDRDLHVRYSLIQARRRLVTALQSAVLSQVQVSETADQGNLGVREFRVLMNLWLCCRRALQCVLASQPRFVPACLDESDECSKGLLGLLCALGIVRVRWQCSPHRAVFAAADGRGKLRGGCHTL